MEDIIALLEKAENQLSSAQETLKRVDTGKASATAERIASFATQVLIVERDLNEKKTLLLAGLVKADWLLTESEGRKSRQRYIDLPGAGRFQVQDGQQIYPPNHNYRVYYAFGTYVRRPELRPHFWPICLFLLSSIQKSLRDAVTSTTQHDEAQTLKKVSDDLSVLALLLSADAHAPA
ncbi:MAG: hypothetical protein JWO84_84 [Parcubacteria group bacterium]|nr:hypothetical protein [Parcubacteria group bacterium]